MGCVILLMRYTEEEHFYDWMLLLGAVIQVADWK